MKHTPFSLSKIHFAFSSTTFDTVCKLGKYKPSICPETKMHVIQYSNNILTHLIEPIDAKSNRVYQCPSTPFSQILELTSHLPLIIQTATAKERGITTCIP